jgi:hypothetical protein
MTESQQLIERLYESGQLISSHQVLLDYPEPDDPWGDRLGWEQKILNETIKLIWDR